MAQNNQKNGGGKAEDNMPQIEFFSGTDEDPIAELVRQGLEQYLAGGDDVTEDGENAPHAGQATPLPPVNATTLVANVAEQVVRKRVVTAMEQAGGCTCTHCISDAIALALNSLTPQYMVTSQKELTQRMAAYEKEHESKITAAVVSACLTVTGHPRH